MTDEKIPEPTPTDEKGESTPQDQAPEQKAQAAEPTAPVKPEAAGQKSQAAKPSAPPEQKSQAAEPSAPAKQVESDAPVKEAAPSTGVDEPAAEQGASSSDTAPRPSRRRGKSGKHVPLGIAFIKATFNNTMVSITDMKGNVVSWGSAGRAGFKGSRKSTAFAATVVAQEAGRQAVAVGMNEVEVRVQGPGAGRESAIRALQSAGLSVTSIKDVTPIPHNGCRPPKRRRV